MSESSKSPVGVSVAVADTNSETFVNNGVINARITIVNAQPPHVPHHPLKHHPVTKKIGNLEPVTNATAGTPQTPSSQSAIAPQVTFANDGDRITTYTSRDGSSASFREDKQNGGAVTFTLRDATGTVVTHANARGYEATKVSALGATSNEYIANDTYLKWPSQFGATVDRLTCPNKTVNVLPALSGDVTRDKLQQFAAGHQELAAALRTVSLPVTLSGGDQITFGEALKRPSEYRACPANSDSAVVKTTR